MTNLSRIKFSLIHIPVPYFSGRNQSKTPLVYLFRYFQIF